MKSRTLFTSLTGLISIGMGSSAAKAQDGFGHYAPYAGGYGAYAPTIDPVGYGGLYAPGLAQPGPYGSYSQPPVDPYQGGGYPTAPGGGYGSDPRGYGAYPPSYGAPFAGPSPVVGLSEQLVGQADAFIQAFAANAHCVPEGRRFLADASDLRDAAVRFHQVALSGGCTARDFRGVASRWQRLESRMARVSRGRIGPNIATALQMGRTIDQIGSLL